MRTLPVAALAMSLVAAGCGLFSKKHAVSIEEQAVPIGSRWNATLSTPADLSGALQVRGTAWMAPAGANRTRVYISVANAAPGGVHPWHVHHGHCDASGGIVGPADAYGTLRIKDDGTASADVEIPVTTPTSGEYDVNVHASPENMGTIIACGNLAPPSQ